MAPIASVSCGLVDARFPPVAFHITNHTTIHGKIGDPALRSKDLFELCLSKFDQKDNSPLVSRS